MEERNGGADRRGGEKGNKKRGGGGEGGVKRGRERKNGTKAASNDARKPCLRRRARWGYRNKEQSSRCPLQLKPAITVLQSSQRAGLQEPQCEDENNSYYYHNMNTHRGSNLVYGEQWQSHIANNTLLFCSLDSYYCIHVRPNSGGAPFLWIAI